MTEVAYVLGVGLAGAGVAMALFHLVAWTVMSLQGRQKGVPDLIPWGYMGLGLAIALVTFYLARGLSGSGWGAIKDAVAMVIVLAVASAGFGALSEWVAEWFERRTRWTIPLLAAGVTGLMLGLAAPNLI